MRYHFILLAIILSTQINAQNLEAENVKSTILEFFEAFHQQDSIALKQITSPDMIMQSISTDKNGRVQLNTTSFSAFVRSIVNIPKDKKFEEKLLGFNIQVDGTMAHAWTPYEFWFDGKFSHCGVNSFQFIKQKEDWKLIYIVDTRRADNCYE